MQSSKNLRGLTINERITANSVFQGTLPPWHRIVIDDGLGFGDAPWTDDTVMGGIIIIMHLGPVAYADATSTVHYKGFGPIDQIFIHELTHVWQYSHGYHVKLSSLSSHVWGGYEPTLGKAWGDYNVEQQATIVERWYGRKMPGPPDPAFPYIQHVIRKGLRANDLRIILPPDQLAKASW